jgi:hypothetical protein
MNLKEIGRKGEDWTNLSQERIRNLIFVNAGLNFRVA